MKRVIKNILFLLLFNYTFNVYAQSNGLYKSEYGFTLVVKNSKKNDSFNFNLSGHLQDKNCACFEISGQASSDPLDEENNGKISYVFYQKNDNGEEEPYAHFEFIGDKIFLKFPEGVSFCGNCFEVDTVYKKVVPKKNNTPKKTSKSTKKK
jgi:hypothetical protein